MKRPVALLVLCASIAACSSNQPPDAQRPLTEKQAGKREERTRIYADPNGKKAIPGNHGAGGSAVRLKQPVAAERVMLDVPLIAQNPELKYGCEVTSLAMVLKYAGIPNDKLKLADEVKKDADPLAVGKNGDIARWGDPRDGFVGDMTGKTKGYAVYAKPLQQLMERYLPGRTVNLTGAPFSQLEDRIRSGKPVIVWTTGDFKLPDRWESWNHGSERIRAPLDLHVVVLAGFDPKYVYLNDPLAAKKMRKVDKNTFIRSWNALGKQALSYR